MSEIYAETSIQDLPDEMLEQILLFLNLDDRRSALQVCRRWSTHKPFDWSSVQLVVDFAKNDDQEADYHRTLLASSRQYKHLVLCFGENSSKYELLVEILQQFSHKVESLKIVPYCFVPIEQMLITQITVIAQITAFCFNLRYLYIGQCNSHFGPQDLEFSPMYKLEELYLEDNLLSLITNLMDITPNITRLHMKNYGYSKKVDMFLRHFSSQLVELEFCFLRKKDFVLECKMHFPLLEKLNFCGSFDKVRMIDLFFHQLPLLKEVTLRSDLADRVMLNLCRSCVNIQFLCVRKSYVSQDSSRAICELKNLKRLRIEEAAVNVSPDMYSPQTSLQKLTLYRIRIVCQAKFNSFVKRAFPNLTVVELLDLAYVNHIDEGRPFEMYGQICSNIPSLQCLVISEPTSDIMLGQFLEFCALHAPKELRFKCKDILDTSENVTLNRIPVQKFFLDSPLISPIVLQKLIGSMEELRWLEIALTEYCSSEEINLLREQFPRCSVVAKRTVVIDEPFGQS